MTPQIHQNYIAGQWLAAGNATPNRNPSDTDEIIGQYAQGNAADVGVEITREPVGVVGLITPWNFPMAIPAWKVAPALAFGNCVVLKPADLVPGCAWALAEIVSRAGLPPGVFNLGALAG